MKTILLFFLLACCNAVHAQEDELRPSLGVMFGMINYEGDLKPNSFTYHKSRPLGAVTLRLPLSRWFVWRSGALAGSVQAADRDNREYLKQRNLSFRSSIYELHTGIETVFFNLEQAGWTPYLFLGGAVFRFNPWTFDEQGKKVYLQPLGTEGQGLDAYPGRLPYRRTQVAVLWAGGFRVRAGEHVRIGLEFSQRKTFTDYLDDVSSSYADYNKLLEARGQQAVDLAYRGDEINGAPYPAAGEQRGTPTEKDWYYYLGITLEADLHSIRDFVRRKMNRGNDWYNQRCPDRF
ncbi:MAG TPA: DUF6089 family protein [Flavisolibacter sp.]